MPKLKALLDAEETASFVLDWGGVEIELSYHPAMITADAIEETAALVRDNDPTEGETWELILAPLCGWDLTDDDGTPLPIDAETLGTLPIALLQEMVAGMRAAVRPTRKRKRSRGGSLSDRR